MPAQRNTPVWYEGAEALQLPPLDGDTSCDVCIVGAGITGLTLAHQLVAAGRSVVVVEARTVAGGVTGRTSGHLTAVLDRDLVSLRRKFGQEGLLSVLQGSMAAIDHIEQVCRAEGMQSAFRRVPGTRYSEKSDEADTLRAETEVARACGLDASFHEAAELPFARAAMRVENQGQLNAVWYTRGLARAIVARGGRIFEDTRVVGVQDGPTCVVETERGRVTAGAVVLASHTPISLRVPMHTRIAPYMSYVLGATLTGPPPAGLWWDTMEPYHYTRTCELPDGRTILVIGGEDHKTGQEPDTRARYTALETYARARFPIAQVEYAWCDEVFESTDGLPYIGRLGTHENLYAATGYAGNGLTFGTLGALGLANLLLGGEGKAIAHVRPQRVGGLGALGDYAKENANVAWHMVADRLRAGGSLDDLPNGEGRTVRVGTQSVAVFRDDRGVLHTRSAVCPHLGGVVQWNRADCTWDCPLHGSRFAATGEMIEGPATRDLPAHDAAERDTDAA
jgi:glycine/D-amino acid oxidase-like deaminating enzyme/nitrite reductase/ring-hydroxylating ferredoxin subunit